MAQNNFNATIPTYAYRGYSPTLKSNLQNLKVGAQKIFSKSPSFEVTPFDPKIGSQVGAYTPAAGEPIDLKGLFGASKNFGWNKSTGLTAFGKNIGKAVPWVQGGVAGIQALKGISDYNNAVDSNEDLLDKIRISAMSNPLLSSYLTSDQLNLVNDIRRGNYDTSSDAGDFFSGIGGGLGDILTGVALGAVGGIPGMVIGGLGAAANAGIEGLSSGTEEEKAELAALYQALQDAEAQYRSMKRPNFTGLGIQQQYQNMYA